MRPHVADDDTVRCQRPLQVPGDLLGFQGIRAVVGVCGKLVENRPAQARGTKDPVWAGELRNALQRRADVTNHSHRQDVMLVDLCRRRIDMDDLPVLVGVPQMRVILHHVVADADDHVGTIEPARHVIPGL